MNGRLNDAAIEAWIEELERDGDFASPYEKSVLYEVKESRAEIADLLRLRDELQAQLITTRAQVALLQSAVADQTHLRSISDAELRRNRRWPIRRFLT